MKYHKKLTREQLLKYGWRTMLQMAASEFSRASSLVKGGGPEVEMCQNRAKEIIGVIESERSLPSNIGQQLMGIINDVVNAPRKNYQAYYDQLMQLAS
jgi:hypothetical protein